MALGGVGGQQHAPAALLPGKIRDPLYRRLGGTQGRSGRVREISPPPWFDPRTVQPVASRYTNWATGPTYMFRALSLTIIRSILTLSLLISYIYGAPCKARNFNFVCMNLLLAMLKVISFYFLHNFSTLNQCRKLSFVTVVCKHFASYQDYPNYRWDLEACYRVTFTFLQQLQLINIGTTYWNV
jgi:hypothetical protein